MNVNLTTVYNFIFSYTTVAILIVITLFIQFIQVPVLLYLKRYLNKNFDIDLKIRSIFGEIRISCLGIDIDIENFSLSSKFFNSIYNSPFVLKFSGIRLEGDIVTASQKLTAKFRERRQKSTSRSEDVFFKKRLQAFIVNQFSISVCNISLMQMGFPKANSFFNDCLIHSTIGSFQAGFEGKSKNQYTLLIEGFSTKLLKANTSRNEKACLAQMSMPVSVKYFTQTNTIDTQVQDLQVIVYDILQLLRILLPNQRIRRASDSSQSNAVNRFKTLETLLCSLQNLLLKSTLQDVLFKLNSGNVKLVREHGNKVLMLSFKPIEFAFNRVACARLETSLSIENFRIHDSESIIDFSLNKCSTSGSIEDITEKLYFQFVLEVYTSTCVINETMINYWFQYFKNMFILFKPNTVTDMGAEKPLIELESNVHDSGEEVVTFHDFIQRYVNKFVFSVDINDISVTLKNVEQNSMITYGLKHLKPVGVYNFGRFIKEISLDLVMETLWCWNGNKDQRPSNLNSLKKYSEKHVPLFMSTLLLKFGNMDSSNLRINCVMDGLQISVGYFLRQLEQLDLTPLKNLFKTTSPSFPRKKPSFLSKYNVLAQVNFTSVNLFTSQLMVRIDSTALDLNGSKVACSVNGFALNHMYASSAELSNYKASELQLNRIVYLSVLRINFLQDVREFSITITEEIYLQWSALFHWDALELYKDIKSICSSLLPSKEAAHLNEINEQKKLYNINLKLDGKIHVAILLTNDGDKNRDLMHFETEFLAMSFQNKRIVNTKWEILRIYFNEVHNCDIENFTLRYVDESKSPINRKAFRLTEKEKNALFEIGIQKFSIFFPYQFDFSYYFKEKFLAIFKWLKKIHSKNKVPPWQLNDPDMGVGADFVIKINHILMEVWDDDFEVKLSNNYGLMEDEFKEREKRWNKILEKIDETRRKGIIIPQSKIEEVQNSYNIQNAQTYIKRSKEMNQSEQARKQLFTIKADNFNLQLLSDTSYNTYDKKISILRTLDCYSPFPEDLKFTTIWCKQILCNIGQFVVRLRDFPQPMLNAKEICLKGVLLGAEQEASARAKRTCQIDMGKDFENFSIERSMTTLKIYHDLTSEMLHFFYTHGACWEPILQQVNLSFEMINRPSTDPSPSLPWWDKMRFLFHGNLIIHSEMVSIVFHASLDPYNSTELIEISFCNANIQFVTGKVFVRNDLHVYVHTASKYDECRIIFWPDINLTFDLNWDCSGNKNDHHSVMPCARDKLPEYTCNQVHDSYRAFRSHHLNLIVSIETRERNEYNNSIDPQRIPSITIYNSTLRWLENKASTITGFPRLTRRGKLYKNTKPRKLPFMRLFKNIQLSVCIQKLEITYWSSFNRNRGFKIKSYNLTHSAGHIQTFHKINDNLIHRPRPLWELVFMNSELKDVEMKLYKACEPSTFNNPKITDHFFLNIDKVSYKREAKLPQSVIEDNDEPNPVHRLIIHDLKGAWTKENRDIALGLFDSYFKTQLLKRNLSTEALRLFKDQKAGSPSKSCSHLAEKGTTYNLSKIEKGNAMNMLQKLISEVDSASVVDTEQIEHVVNDRAMLYGIEACQTNDVLLDNCLIELINSQVMLRGCETDGYVIISAAKATISQRIHRPVWKNRVLYSKTTWQTSLECMQYYATVDAGGLRIDDVTWLDLDDIEERMSGDEIPDIEERMSGDEIPDLFESGRSVGGVVKSEAGGSSTLESKRVPIQLQRIVSRCQCHLFYASYGENADPNNYEEVPPLPHESDFISIEPFEKECAVDTFTISHEELDISTNSQQYSMIMDLINNLLLYVEPHKKEVYEKQQRIRFSMQLNSLEDQREPISKLQDKVRTLVNRIKKNEKEIYRMFKKESAAVVSSAQTRERKDEIELDLEECKEELSASAEDLNIMINAYKEAQLIASKTKERQVAAQESRNQFIAVVMRRNEVCFKKASWRLTDADGQLGLSDLELNNFFYTKVSKNDDSVQHSFELGYIQVQNRLPNQAYQEVLQPTELQPNMPVDQQRALRILCIEKAPVGGIAVKEHLEVNVVPMTIKLTMAFFQKMLKFFFPERALAPETPQTSQTAPPANGQEVQTLEMASDDISLGKGTKKKSAMRRDESSYSIPSSLSTFILPSTELQNIQHIEKMRERSSKNQVFVFIKISEVPIQISYKGGKNKNLSDLHNVSLTLPAFEYHNRNWTWLDILMALKRDSKRILISQAIRHKVSNKFHITKSKPLTNAEGSSEKKPQNESTTSGPSSHDEEKARILLGDIVMPPKAKSRSLLSFGTKKS